MGRAERDDLMADAVAHRKDQRLSIDNNGDPTEMMSLEELQTLVLREFFEIGAHLGFIQWKPRNLIRAPACDRGGIGIGFLTRHLSQMMVRWTPANHAPTGSLYGLPIRVGQPNF